MSRWLSWIAAEDEEEGSSTKKMDTGQTDLDLEDEGGGFVGETTGLLKRRRRARDKR